MTASILDVWFFALVCWLASFAVIHLSTVSPADSDGEA
jgi:hypothetical protein